MTKTRIAIFISVVQVILFSAHYFVYKIFTLIFGITGGGSLLFARVGFFLLSISFMSASMFNYWFYGAFGRAIYKIAAVLLGTFYWTIFAAFGASLLYIILGLSFAGTVGQILMFGAIPVSIYGLINSHITRVTLVNIKIPNLPQTWMGKKAVLVGDTHFGSYWNLGFAEKMVKIINEQNPDIVFFPGDFYDGPPADYEALAKPFTNIKAKHGIYLCAGNHEEFGDPSPFFVALRKAGIKVLDNELATVDGVQIIGIGFHMGQKPERQTELFKKIGVNINMPSILLKHEPSHIETAEQFNISLQVSGHTHKGQMWPLNNITKKIYGKFHTGLNKLNTTQVYTTVGAGAWGPPQRVGNHPEIVVMTFE